MCQKPIRASGKVSPAWTDQPWLGNSDPACRTMRSEKKKRNEWIVGNSIVQTLLFLQQNIIRKQKMTESTCKSRDNPSILGLGGLSCGETHPMNLHYSHIHRAFFFFPLSIILINSSRIHRMGSQAGRSQAEVHCLMKLKFKKESRSSQCPQPQGRPLYRVPKADSRVSALRGGRWGSERGRGLWGRPGRERGFLEPQAWPRVHFSRMSDA